MILKQEGFFAASASDGSMRPESPDGHGLWFSDTRFLSEYRLLVGGVEPELLDLRTDDGWAAFDLEANGLHVHRVRYIDRGLHERITVANPGPAAVDTDLELVVAADFAAMLAVRGIVPQLPPATPAPSERTSHGLRIRRDGADRATRIAVQPEGTRHRLQLAAGELFSLIVDVVPETLLSEVSASADPSPQPSPPRGEGVRAPVAKHAALLCSERDG
jgi:hypothetical protein